jgi:glycosyltransferase involved in cell wall biosynthesis
MVERVERLGVAAAVISAGAPRHVWRLPYVATRIARAARRSRADVVFAHVARAQMYAGPASVMAGVPNVWFQHELPTLAPRIQAYVNRLPTAGVICNSETVLALQRSRWQRRPAHLVHPGVEEPRSGPRHHVVAGAGVRFIHVSRLQRLKRVERAIEAMAGVVAEEPETSLEILGDAEPGIDPDYPAQLRALAAARRLDGSVTFRGHVPDAGGSIAAADVLVQVSDQEGFGLVVVEAMMRGVPVVAPKDSAAADIVRDGIDGLLVDPTDTGALAQAMLHLARDPALRTRMGAAGAARARERFGAHRMARETWNIVGSIARGASRHRSG